MTSITTKSGKKQKNGKSGFKPGDVITSEIPYSGKDGSKTRPLVVLSSCEHNRTRQDLVVAKISSSAVNNCWEVAIKKWLEAGLIKPSKVVCDHITVVSKTSAKVIGHMDPKTFAEVKNKIGSLLGL